MNEYDYASGADNGGLIAVLFGVMLIPALIIGILTIIGLWRTFQKAGKPGWAAIIPIYNYIVMLEIVGKPIWWIILLLIPCVNIVIAIWVLNLIAKSFGKSEGFTIGLVLFPMIFFPILGFGSATYLGPSAAEAKGMGMPGNNPFNNPPQV
ncbi:DUF5684 domain-containing protein [Mucilaginibacter auburnensis]|uniref:Signal peptidase I n=1 Tax=Mucilaginibacter auburnensis TaxID=1457233 RepID=A0A2H9VSR7_9SPHI|nr:DUF5684 domain-containing protein [Mucilaginibacter auburnensis]PJJ83839.1 hypothetical protein CLV57_0834 [Mucilaginibacter auburnensis]